MVFSFWRQSFFFVRNGNRMFCGGMWCCLIPVSPFSLFCQCVKLNTIHSTMLASLKSLVSSSSSSSSTPTPDAVAEPEPVLDKKTEKLEKKIDWTKWDAESMAYAERVAAHLYSEHFLLYVLRGWDKCTDICSESCDKEFRSSFAGYTSAEQGILNGLSLKIRKRTKEVLATKFDLPVFAHGKSNGNCHILTCQSTPTNIVFLNERESLQQS